MKKLLAEILLFAIPVIVLAYPLDLLITNNLRKSNAFAGGENPVWNDIVSGKINSKIIIHGSSRAWINIDPTMMGERLNTSVYNLGISGHNFWLQNLRHKLLLKNNPKPLLIIHSLDVFTLQKKKELYNSDQLLPYMLWNRDIKNAVVKYDEFNYLDFWLPLLRYRGDFDAVREVFKIAVRPQSNVPVRVRGYQGQDLTWNFDLEKAKKSGEEHRIELDPELIAVFEEYLKECAANNIKIIFVYTPEYVEGHSFVGNRAEIMKLYEDLSKKYEIPYYDFSGDEISFEKKYFYNTLHLNKTGAEIFTAKLTETLKNDNPVLP